MNDDENNKLLHRTNNDDVRKKQTAQLTSNNNIIKRNEIKLSKQKTKFLTKNRFIILLFASSSLIVLLLSYFFSASSLAFLIQSVLFSTTTTTNSVHKEDTNKMATGGVDAWKSASSIYEFSANDIDGNAIELSKYKNRVVLIVNVACNCGFTGSNYPQMQELHKKYEKDGFSMLAFPCNQFGGQEPKPEKEIKEFVKQYNVEFDMFSKIDVNGDKAHPLYKYLKSKVDGTFGNFIKWNFSKFLIDRDGQPVKRYSPTVAPKDIENDIVKLLNGEKV